MSSKLSDICSYVKGKTSVALLTADTYISTENMLPNKGGITTASALPSVEQTQTYKKNDVLVSNIRPYFKKIWQAEYDGGCSNDVLIFRATEGCDPAFLYYVLADDNFFNYATATSRGTKMPRGDKSAIMKYDVPTFNIRTQQRIGHILRGIDKKIVINNKIRDNLQRQIFTLYDSWFVTFNRTDGVMPSEWREGALGDIATVTSGKRPPMKQLTPIADAQIPLVGAASVIGYTNAVLYEEPILVIGRVGTHGIVQRFQTPCWTSDNTLVIKSNFYEFVYQILQRIDYANMNRGSTQPLITQTDLKNVSIALPPNPIIREFEKMASTLMSIYDANHKENEQLAALRDSLIPKLMSGEIDVSGVAL